MNTARYVLSISFATLLLGACQSEEITSPATQGDLSVREAKATASGYTPIEIAPLPGDVESVAWAVNNSGYVSAWSTYYSTTEWGHTRWFIRAGSENFIHTTGVNDLSNGATTYVVGNLYPDGRSAAAMWTFHPSTGFSGETLLDSGPGAVQAVNDVGQAAGAASYGAAIWNTDGTRTDIPNPDPSVFEGLEMRDINNSGDVVIHLHDNDLNHNRGYLRTSDGTMILLPPQAGHVSSVVRGVSEIIDGVLYVAGTSDDRQGNYRAVRWTVDVATHAIVATQVRPDRSNSMAMADDGTIVGNISNAGGATPFVWRTNNSTVTLKAPKGLNSAAARAISGNGRYIAGSANSGNYIRAVYWAATP